MSGDEGYISIILILKQRKLILKRGKVVMRVTHKDGVKEKPAPWFVKFFSIWPKLFPYIVEVQHFHDYFCLNGTPNIQIFFSKQEASEFLKDSTKEISLVFTTFYLRLSENNFKWIYALLGRRKSHRSRLKLMMRV